MTVLLIFILVLVTLVCWVFGTSLTVNKSANTLISFIGKSIFYWIAIIISFMVGHYLKF